MSGIFEAFLGELRDIFGLKPAFATLILAALIYAAFYPQPYLNEALRHVPIAVVDQDHTEASRELTRALDASADVAVALVLPDLATAERQVYERSISGILVIPQYFERELLHGRATPIALYADASYFLIYQRISGAVTGVAHAFGAEVEAARLVERGVDPSLARAATDPMPLTAVPLFNPQGGYATYVLPAAFVLLLQQLLLMGTGLVNTLSGRRALVVARPSVVATVLGKALAYLALEAVILPAYLIVLPYLYGVPRLGSVPAILAMGVPFVLAVSCLGMVVAAIFRTALAVQLAMAAIGLPFFFLSGFSWPFEAIPRAIRLVALLVPSTTAIDGMVRIGQLGGTLYDVRTQFFTLWALAALYGLLAIALEAWRRKTGRRTPTAASTALR